MEYVRIGSVGTGSDSIPPNASRRAPPAHEVAGAPPSKHTPAAALCSQQALKRWCCWLAARKYIENPRERAFLVSCERKIAENPRESAFLVPFARIFAKFPRKDPSIGIASTFPERISFWDNKMGMTNKVISFFVI